MWVTIIVILAIILGGGYYFFFAERGMMPGMMDNETMENGAQMTADADPAVEALKVQGTSDELSDIQADLNATDLAALLVNVN